ncbi:glycine zipper 2TM domain-containing protein [Aromatoleum toluclasticum]|uniref:glycine zipper 2TM domain-containing protein n=1 Tax=Aromatoleum toluclasticum TaxID=92003 RepID=UPI001D186FF9|nr:glycine zipper 2TM domain-containing protein [Aromatoleum toluclasticum]MCC4117759.1 glycine zipper 2TM domain-containing protein [Aromatoleum toluclasticum]
MRKYWVPVLMATAMISANAFAGHDWDDDERCDRRQRVERIVERDVYEEPQVVYRERRIVYREPRVIYREAPVVYRQAPTVYRERVEYRDRPDYSPPEPYYDERQGSYRRYDEPRRDRVVGQAVGAVAGGLIGNQIGRGSGRVAATAVGAVVGGILGGQIADYGY